MISLELANKLKEKGFPSDCWKITECVGAKCNLMTPTLSELIEACGDGFLRLTHHIELKESFFRANSYIDDNDYIYKTPEEAVAHLWIALQDR